MRQIQLDAPRSLAQRVIVQIRQAIIEGRFPLGSLIPEEMLAQSFGVSRTPVREAISQLQLEGLVVVRPQVGSFVFSPNAEDIVALTEFRMTIEPQAARLSLKNNHEKVTHDLLSAVKRMEEALSCHNFPEYGHADTEFHQTLLNHCGNPYLQQAYQLITGRMAALRYNLAHPVMLEDPSSLEEHKTLANLFAAGDFAQFEKIMDYHLWKAGEVYTRILNKSVGNDVVLAS